MGATSPELELRKFRFEVPVSEIYTEVGCCRKFKFREGQKQTAPVI